MPGELPAEEDKGGNEMTLNELITKAAGVRDRFSSADLALTIMEMGQGRRVKDITLDPYDDDGQYKVRVTFETEEAVSARPTARERIAFIRERLLDELGFDPFASRDRHRPMVYWRQCVMFLMLREGYRCGEVGRSCGYDHSTAVFARRQISGYLASGDKAITAIWVRLGKIVNV